ncbi:bifunctional demethylmenaquinone methyltransferase/2-methoxy-6-polyprenyl-1,4-benzoquinol methylase UbiE [Accumulibacter sp.]|uniref:bifunctional demethylmenaquinone methyltransferase/2-methoxy-6-polyprenyl-1,4-benzoquinol methylase UbiE n=1 Tax=Accumulibacter sp. TaxID=2053492 RepID=UPI0025D42D80|nr:bifunctional demethylmenaquinone methyltransferase/2-methoxy-6-polyprenyl-1,4-benzoquinol methylase UbiE [Accumulibacter sp.]MCM8595932.1 bifunctional demethylmenaquinone methyltransferase/2-methoxy-6-polyprenyl-1,4-benzoquinol methylase UbiE [Accumulibacter sp.]MCM8624543.1 bifunctional demethylmenaquinone methyltransferase/2-methoxy-6-polyprenyl-1,4-benzoquinol methylase UbiE [Accumulibacter sp.]MDS4050081.1 bifunctional demethylmenaquinone methyltransferase/2-methoxy-6-polyprenyl-1,4-benzo
MNNPETTHFGYQEVPVGDKARHVAGVFDSVAGRYDLMNDLMSAGLHRLWKTFAVARSGVREGWRVLDVAGGTGDLAEAFAGKVGERGQVWLTDINNAMLTVGRDRLFDQGVMLPVAQCDAESLPFPDEYFDCVSVAFGLRNMTHKDRALAEMLRVLRPGGRVLILEFARVWKPLAPFYDFYSFQVIPRLGRWITDDEASYRYLAESIRVHPDQESLKKMMEQVGFDRVDYYNLALGVVALHLGFRF